MKNYLTKIFHSNWFYISLLLFALVLPLSEALVSISGGIVLLVALVEDTWKNKLARLKQNRILGLTIGIFLLFLLSSVITFKSGNVIYDLKKNLFFLVIPLAFMLGRPINDFQKRFLFYAFTFSISVSIIVGLVRWFTVTMAMNFEVHTISLISHIRFSFQLILAFWFFMLLLHNNRKSLMQKQIIAYLLIALYVISFLFFQQSLTGLIAFGTSVVFFVFYIIIQQRKKFRIPLLIILSALIFTPVFYVLWVVHSFYNIEKIDRESIAWKTAQGNNYTHDFDNPTVENGKYVFLFVCDSEMREEWNKISDCKYDSIGKNGYVTSATLIRYLTSKGLKKDAEGVRALTEQDIKNVENGIANVIYQEKKYSLYPRIYQTIWEYYVYTKTGNANYKSFSQRIEYSKAALSIIKKNLWFGVGTGNWKNEFKDAYRENNSQLTEDLYASSHNQYLNYMVKFGIIGFVLIMFLIVYPVFYAGRFKDPLFLIFLVFLFFANFADSNFESHMGNSFFTFFYCIFLISGSINYLKLERT